MNDDNKTKVKIHPFKGLEMESPTTKHFLHYVGVALVLCAVGFVIHVIAPNGLI